MTDNPTDQPGGDAPAIEVRALRKRFGRTLAVDGLSFTVAPGTVTGFVGPNGAGKSTTLRSSSPSTPPTRARPSSPAAPTRRCAARC